jgi:hypothetical protein
MPSTTNLVLPYPALTAAPNVPADIQALADRLEAVFGVAAAGIPTAASTTYSPGWSAATILTLSVNSGRYRRVGRLIQATGQLTASNTSAIGGFISTAPVAPAVTNVGVPMGTWMYFPNGGGAKSLGTVVYSGSGAGIQFWRNGDSAAFGVAVAAGDGLTFNLCYEAT